MLFNHIFFKFAKVTKGFLFSIKALLSPFYSILELFFVIMHSFLFISSSLLLDGTNFSSVHTNQNISVVLISFVDT